MEIKRNTSLTFGILIILGMIFGILSSVPALELPDFLSKLATIKKQVLLAAFFQFAMACVYALITVFLYPVIKKYNKKLALSYFGFRIISTMFLFVGIVSLLILLFISQEFVSAGEPENSYFHTLGEMARLGRDWFNHVTMILSWSIGGLILYFSLYKMKNIPKWLSISGIFTSVITLVTTLFLLFDSLKIASPLYFTILAPSAVFELILAIYMIRMGLRKTIKKRQV